jgi:hypothetical protein
MDNFRFKGTCKETIPAALVFWAFPCALLVMSIKGLLDMSSNEDKTMQIVGVAFISVLLLMALVYLAHTLLFRVVVEDKTIKVRGILGTKKMDIHNCIECICKLKGSVGNNRRPGSLHYVITIVDETKKITFKLVDKSSVEQFLFILIDAGVRVQRIDLA